MRGFALGTVVGAMAVLAAAFVVGWFGLFATRANAVPPAWEATFAQRALYVATARRAPHLANPVAPTEANLRFGMKLYKDSCAGCHGLPDGNADARPNLYPSPRQFAKQPPTLPDWQLYAIVKYGVRYSGMFAWDGVWGKDSTGRDVTDDHIWTILTFLRRLDSLPPGIAAEWHHKASA